MEAIPQAAGTTEADNTTIWRLILDGPGSASRNMAVDEALAGSVRTGASGPVLRFYGWNTPSLSLGYFQSLNTDVDVSACRARGIPVIRRLTGGRAILHDDELTYTVVASTRQKPFDRGIYETYRVISSALVRGLKLLGVSAQFSRRRPGKAGRRTRNPVCFHSLGFGEVHVSGRKLVGSAQRRWPEAFLQHGSIPITYTDRDILELLRCADGDLRHNRGGPGDNATGLSSLVPEFDRGALIPALKAGFENEFACTFVNDRLTEDESRHARELQRNKYGSRDWLARR